MDLAITNALVVTMAADRPGLGILTDGTVAISGTEIDYVGPATEFDSSEATQILDGTGRLVIPGLVNAHTHTALTLVRGGAQDVPESEWMNRALAPLSRALEPDDRVAGSRLGVLEALRRGVTTFGEYDTQVGTLVERVYEPLGVRVVATETINEIASDRDSLGPRELPEFDRDRGEAALDRTERLFDRYADHGRVDVMYGPQALDMVSAETLELVSQRASERNRDVHVHVAQGERERRQIDERYGDSSVAVLEDLGLADERLLAAHLHGARPDERVRLAEAGVRMVGCPGSIGTIDGRVPPVAEYHEHGGSVGVGTDQAPGNGRHDVLRELHLLTVLTKCERTDPRALTASRALWLGTMGGARALGLSDRIGSLETGKRADLAVVDRSTETMLPAVESPLQTAIPNLVYAAGGDAVETVIVGGEVVVRDGAVQTVDTAEIRRRAAARGEAVFERAAEAWRATGHALCDDVDAGWL